LIVGELRQGARGRDARCGGHGGAAAPAEVSARAILPGLSRRSPGGALGGAGRARETPDPAHAPVPPMLAQPAEDVAAALEQPGTAILERLDGARVQCTSRATHGAFTRAT
jgi:ATP-dependent DNA ligase